METALRTPGFAEIYERVLVPTIFGPWAQEAIERARPIGPSDRILDLGCGTGIVARQLRGRLGGGVRIAGADVNAEMIAMARLQAPELEWHQANATELPFADASFDLVVCQQMLQFVPDPVAALREIRRVLVPGGRLVAATWRPRHELPFYEVLGQIAERHLGTANERRFALGDAELVRSLVTAAGFANVEIEIVARIDHLRDYPYRGNALAANFDLSGMSADERESRLARIEAESIEASKAFATDSGIASPSRANLITATAKDLSR